MLFKISNNRESTNSFKTLRITQNKTEVRISVLDEGPGIPEDQIKKITKAFVRIPNSKKSGFGLGLSICNKVMLAHGGSLEILNRKSGGSCFSLVYPKEK